MSADNWAACPQCVADAQHEKATERVELEALYGKIPMTEWTEKRDAHRAAAVDPADYLTFREDYEFYGAEDGVIVASYSGHCSKCGLGTDFKYSKRFWEFAA